MSARPQIFRYLRRREPLRLAADHRAADLLHMAKAQSPWRRNARPRRRHGGRHRGSGAAHGWARSRTRSRDVDDRSAREQAAASAHRRASGALSRDHRLARARGAVIPRYRRRRRHSHRHGDVAAGAGARAADGAVAARGTGVASMDCTKAQALRHPYLDGEIDPVDASALEAHLRGCAECAAAFRRDRELSAAIKLEVPRYRAPELLRARIRTELARRERWRFSELRLLGVGWNPAAIAASLMLAVIMSSAVTRSVVTDGGVDR